MGRIDKQNYYLDIAATVLERSTCMRRCYGAIIVQNDEIVSSGYNGAPRGRKNCGDLGYCAREAMNIPSGQRYELCRSVHAEANAIISAGPRLHLLLHVPPPHHQRGHRPGGDPGHRRGIPGGGRGEGVD